MKKRTRNLVILLVVLVILAAAYLVVSLVNKAKEQKAEEEAAAAEVHIGAITDANAISYTADGELLSFVKEDDTWKLTSDPDFPILQTYITRIANAVKGLTAVRAVEAAESLDSYGLAEPENVLTVSDGTSTLVLKIGKQSGENYFVMEEGSDKICTIASTLPSYLTSGRFSMVNKESIRPVSENEVRRISLSNGEKAFTFLKVVKSNSSYTWYAELNGERAEQIAVYQPTGETELTAKSYLEKAIETIASQSFAAAVDYKSDKDYGLGKNALRVTVEYLITNDDKSTEKGSYTLLVGNEAEDGSYYATLDGSQMIYTIAAEDVTAFISALNALGV